MQLNVCPQSNLERESWKENGVKQFAYLYTSHIFAVKFIHSFPLFTCTCTKASLIYDAEKKYNTGQEISKCWFDVSFHQFPFPSFVTQRQKWQIFLIWKLFNRNMILHIYILAEGQLEGGNSCFHTFTPLDFNFSGIIKLHLNSYLITYSIIRGKCRGSINSTLKNEWQKIFRYVWTQHNL